MTGILELVALYHTGLLSDSEEQSPLANLNWACGMRRHGSLLFYPLRFGGCVLLQHNLSHAD